MNILVAAMAGAALSGSVYMAGWGNGPGSAGALADRDSCEDCSPVAHVTVMAASAPAATAPVSATIPAGVKDMKNAKCIVQLEDPMGEDVFVIYQGKAYHCCCTSCVATFNKDPEKYVKLYEADPAKYGVRK